MKIVINSKLEFPNRHFKVKSLANRRAFWLVLVLSVCKFSGGYAQSNWEKIQDSKVHEITQEEKNLRELFQDANFNLGHEDKPSPRSGASLWQDADKNVWMFGGTGVGENGIWGIFGDLWKFSPVSNIWALQNGDRNKTTDRLLKDQEPGARRDAINWIDKHGTLWLMGGKLLNDNEFMSDVWTYEPKKQKWSNVKAKGTFNQNASWEEKGNIEGKGSPGSRSGAATWTDKKGNLWFFGGTSQIYSEGRQNYYNDLWQFNPNSRSWKWVSAVTSRIKRAPTKRKGKRMFCCQVPE
jgi:N-acetylneuraminic acid mutarotase